MAFNWHKFPWTNLHELNLDWIIQTVKTLENNLADAVGRFTEIVNTAVGAEREERIAKDAEIQAEIVTEVYPAISKSITDTLTGSGDLTISKTGDVNISGAHVNLSNTCISAGSEQLTMHNATSNTSMGANYNSGTLTLTNNQNEAAGVALYAINTPADGGGDNSSFAANVGYVKDAVAAVDGKLDTEITNRTSGDAALQSTIDDVIMPRLNSLSAASNSYVLLVTGAESTESDIPLTSEQVTALQNAAQNNSPITMILRDGDSYTAYYPIEGSQSSMTFGRGATLNSSGGIDVNQALGRVIIASVRITEGAGNVTFIELPSGLTPFLPLSLSIIWAADSSSYTLTDKEYAILRQSLLDKRPVFIVRNTADAGGEQTIYMLQTCATPSILNVDSMTLILQGPSNSSNIKVQMSSKTIVPNVQ